MYDTITIVKKGAKRLRGGHPWAFRGEISAASPDLAPGSVVKAIDELGYLIGLGFYNAKTLITFRLITRQDEVIDRAFWKRRLERALALRRQVLDPQDDTGRMIHAEADGIPGLIADRYGSVLVVQLLTAGIERERAQWIELLREVYQPHAILARNDQKPRELEGLIQEKVALYGEVPPELIVKENGIRLIVDPWNGQKTGAFLDQRENRVAIRPFAKGKVLDAFCYQGWFALHCAPTAEKVIALDGSAPAVEMVRRNATLNGFENIEAVQENVFDYLYAADKRGDRFDTILLDPPAFAKSKDSIEAGVKGYKEINLRAMRLLPEGDILVTSSCSYHLSEERFLTVVEEAARDGGRQIQVLEKRTQGKDHPLLLTHPESYYLKCFILRVL